MLTLSRGWIACFVLLMSSAVLPVAEGGPIVRSSRSSDILTLKSMLYSIVKDRRLLPFDVEDEVVREEPKIEKRPPPPSNDFPWQLHQGWVW
uniref:Uncharacterized protein n=1 Tax=Plectus sambesii TaxID=2011161 RepID=A0A914X8C2_9BILA